MVLDGQSSDPVHVLSGVPQGSVSGPVLFLIFINELSDTIKTFVHLFADDCILYRNIKSLTDSQILQEHLNDDHNGRPIGKWNLMLPMSFNEGDPAP